MAEDLHAKFAEKRLGDLRGSGRRLWRSRSQRASCRLYLRAPADRRFRPGARHGSSSLSAVAFRPSAPVQFAQSRLRIKRRWGPDGVRILTQPRLTSSVSMRMHATAATLLPLPEIMVHCLSETGTPAAIRPAPPATCRLRGSKTKHANTVYKNLEALTTSPPALSPECRGQDS
jgi:hypothetical protein